MNAGRTCLKAKALRPGMARHSCWAVIFCTLGRSKKLLSRGVEACLPPKKWGGASKLFRNSASGHILHAGPSSSTFGNGGAGEGSTAPLRGGMVCDAMQRGFFCANLFGGKRAHRCRRERKNKQVLRRAIPVRASRLEDPCKRTQRSLRAAFLRALEVPEASRPVSYMNNGTLAETWKIDISTKAKQELRLTTGVPGPQPGLGPVNAERCWTPVWGSGCAPLGFVCRRLQSRKAGLICPIKRAPLRHSCVEPWFCILFT